jgi:hypothetical protein
MGENQTGFPGFISNLDNADHAHPVNPVKNLCSAAIECSIPGKGKIKIAYHG